MIILLILYDKYNITNESLSSNELSVILNNVIGVGDIIFDFSLINKIQYNIIQALLMLYVYHDVLTLNCELILNYMIFHTSKTYILL